MEDPIRSQGGEHNLPLSASLLRNHSHRHCRTACLLNRPDPVQYAHYWHLGWGKFE